MNTYSVRFAPIDPKGLPWVFPVEAQNSASAVVKAVREMIYIYAQDPNRFHAPTIEGAPK